MKYMYLGKSGIKVSRVAFGSWQIGGGTAWEADDSMAEEIISSLPECGINFIDTAKVYGTGHSEELLGRVLASRRDDFVLSSKGGMNWRDGKGERFCYSRDGQEVYQNTSAAALRLDLEESLTRLRTDHLDCYFTHRQPITVKIEETMGALMDFKREGKIRAIGISNASIEQLKEYMLYGTVDVVQEKFSMLDRAGIEEYARFCGENGVTFQAYSVMERGVLTGSLTRETETRDGRGNHGMIWYQPERREAILAFVEKLKPLAERHSCSVANIAVAYAISFGDYVNVIAGGRSAAHIKDSANAAEVCLDPSEMEHIHSEVDSLLGGFECSTHQI